MYPEKGLRLRSGIFRRPQLADPISRPAKRISKSSCHGCGKEEYLLSQENLCTACQQHGPPWFHWTLFWALLLLAVIFFLSKPQ